MNSLRAKGKKWQSLTSVAFSLQYQLLGNHVPCVNFQRKRETLDDKVVSAFVINCAVHKAELQQKGKKG